MNGPELKAACQEAADVAVAKMLHRTRIEEFHDRYGKGDCPLCSPIQNALWQAGFYERLREAVERLK